MSEKIKYNPVFDGGPIAGLPRGGRGYGAAHSAITAAANQRRDLFSGSGKSNHAKLGIKEGYSFTGGPGKTLVDTVRYSGSGAYNSGILNIYRDAAPMETGGGDDDGGDDDGGNDGTTGPVDPIGPVTGGDSGGSSGGGGSSGPSLQDLIDTIANMSAPTINIPPPPVYEPPPSFAAVGQAASANPGVRIRRSRSRAQGTNTLGTNFFNRGTRNTLRISGLNV